MNEPINKIDEKVDELRKELGEIELGVVTEGYTLANAIREGSIVTEKCTGGWGNGDDACGNSAAYLALRARGLVDGD